MASIIETATALAEEKGLPSGSRNFSVCALALVDVDGNIVGPPTLATYTVANLPNPAWAGRGAQAYATNEVGGEVPVFCDGAAWRRVTDRAVAVAAS